jgi:hypothetical protein
MPSSAVKFTYGVMLTFAVVSLALPQDNAAQQT